MGDYIAVYIPSPNGASSPSGGIFGSLQEAAKCANTPEAKARGGARFKRFNREEDAQAFVEHGDDSRLEYSGPHSLKNSFSESISTYPSVTPVILNRLRKAIETKDNKAFESFVKENPRCLVNIGSDRPTIVFEGCRYNALHIAAKCGNCFVIRYVLKFISDVDSLLRLYGTSVEDVECRSKALLDSYLNTPDKGAGDVPLHFASKFGHDEAVEILLSYKGTEKDRLNNENKTAADVCACRYNGADKVEVRNAILRLFNSFYVPLYRPKDNSSSAIICEPGRYPLRTLTTKGKHSSFTEYVISAVAGPFDGIENARNFQREWISKERDKRLRDPVKGAEEVGRNLAKLMGVKWMEKWPFSQQLVDLNSFEGLKLLNSFLINLRKKQISRDENVFKELNVVRKCLVFDDESDDGSDNESFVDALDYVERMNKSGNSTEDDEERLKDSSFDTNDSISYLTRKIQLLRLDDSSEICCDDDDAVTSDTKSEVLSFTSIDFDDSENVSLKRNFPESAIVEIYDNKRNVYFEEFYTPPSSPKSIYINDDILTKDDENLVAALNLVDIKIIDQFFAIKEYMRKIKKIPAAERAQLPYIDSPRAKDKKRWHEY